MHEASGRFTTLPPKNPANFQGYRGASPLEWKFPGNSRKRGIISSDNWEIFLQGGTSSSVLSGTCLVFCPTVYSALAFVQWSIAREPRLKFYCTRWAAVEFPREVGGGGNELSGAEARINQAEIHQPRVYCTVCIVQRWKKNRRQKDQHKTLRICVNLLVRKPFISTIYYLVSMICYFSKRKNSCFPILHWLSLLKVFPPSYLSARRIRCN
jgi:hypothetical protein